MKLQLIYFGIDSDVNLLGFCKKDSLMVGWCLTDLTLGKKK